jgi:hypothetical protein
MKASHSKLATIAKPGYLHSGKVDRDDGLTHSHASETRRRIIKKTKAKQRRILDKIFESGLD